MNSDSLQTPQAIFLKSLEIMHRLRHECPWDKEQTLASLRSFLLEEAYECADALDQKIAEPKSPSRTQDLIEELGDVFMQVIFQAELLGEEAGHAVIGEIIGGLNEKLIRRHPHIFTEESGASKKLNASEVLTQWNKIKETEKKPSATKPTSWLKTIPKAMTALQTSQKLGQRAREAIFDWEKPEEVFAQFLAEVEELKEAVSPSDLEHEVGDVLFCIVQWARHRELDAEVALHRANQRFISRFKTMEAAVGDDKEKFKAVPLLEKEKLWQAAKKKLAAELLGHH